jgi:hypothetical protein
MASSKIAENFKLSIESNFQRMNSRKVNELKALSKQPESKRIDHNISLGKREKSPFVLSILRYLFGIECFPKWISHHESPASIIMCLVGLE